MWSWSTDHKLLPELESILRPGLTLFVSFDSDRLTNENVRTAEASLAAVLAEKGGGVRIVELQPGPNGEKTGIDDFFFAAGRRSNSANC